MSSLHERLEEVRVLRKAARRNFRNELEYVRAEVSPSALRARLSRKLGSKIEAAGEEVAEFAEREQRTLAAIGAALACATGLWLARHRIASAVSPLFSSGPGAESADGPYDSDEDVQDGRREERQNPQKG